MLFNKVQITFVTIDLLLILFVTIDLLLILFVTIDLLLILGFVSEERKSLLQVLQGVKRFVIPCFVYE